MKARHSVQGQMMVELCLVFPLVIIISAIAINAMTFFAHCNELDRVGRNAIRHYATSPSTAYPPSQIAACMETRVAEALSFKSAQVSCRVESCNAGLLRYTIEVELQPQFFGLETRDVVWGVRIPRLKHKTSLTIDPFSPQTQVDTHG